jgi:hypothetical protein
MTPKLRRRAQGVIDPAQTGNSRRAYKIGMALMREPVALRWPGARTLHAARAAIRQRLPVEIELPLETHHALCMRLHPDAPRTSAADLDESGGPELVAPLAAVAGLEQLSALERALRRAHYRLQVTSPEPVLRLTPVKVARA